MKSYIITLMALSFLASVIAAIAPDGKRGGLSRHTKLLCSLVLICVLTGPLMSLIETVSELKLDFSAETESADQDRLFVESISKLSAAQLEGELTSLIEDRFEIKNGNVRVKLEYTTDTEVMTVDRIVVTLSGAAIFKSPYEIEEYVEKLTNAECDCVL